MNHYFLFFIIPLLFGFNFSPMSQTIELGEGRKGAQFLIENEGSSNIAIELTVKQRKMDQNGDETLEDTKDIAVFPPQIIIPPNEKRTIRVSFNSKENPLIEKNYRVIAEQLPLKVDPKKKNESGVQMLMKFVAALYATPEGAKPDLKVLSQTSNGKELVLVLENSGTRHQLLNGPVLKYFHAGEKGEIKASDLTGLVGENVLAGQKRTFTIKTKRIIPVGSRIELKLND
jgi:fimbrial chaperone protein